MPMPIPIPIGGSYGHMTDKEFLIFTGIMGFLLGMLIGLMVNLATIFYLNWNIVLSFGVLGSCCLLLISLREISQRNSEKVTMQ